MSDPLLPPQNGVPPIPPAPGQPQQPVSPAQPVAPAYEAPTAQQPPYVAPAYQQAASGAYAAPGYAPPGYLPAAPTPANPKTKGLIAFFMSLFVFVISPIIAAALVFPIGAEFARQGVAGGFDEDNPMEIFEQMGSVSGAALGLDILGWGSTLVGIAAIVLGIIAIVKRAGRGYGVAAIVIAAIAPIIFVTTLLLAFATGAATVGIDGTY